MTSTDGISKKSRAIRELDHWLASERKKNTSDPTRSSIQYTRSDGNDFYFKAGAQQYKIIVPSTYPKSEDEILFLDYDNVEDGYNWIINVNEYIMEKNPSFRKLLGYTSSEYMKNPVSLDFFDKDSDDIISVMEDRDLLSNLEIELMRLEKELSENLRSGSMNDFGQIESNSSNTSKAPVLFKGNVPGEILIGELMRLMKKYKQNSFLAEEVSSCNSESNIEVRPVNKNVFHWNLKFRNFSEKELNASMQQLNEKHKYDYIELEIYFHPKLYPGYPPFIKAVRPKLEHSLMHRISNLQMVQFEFWSIARGMDYVVDKLYTIINKSATVDIESSLNTLDTNICPNGAYHPMEETLVKLASLYDSTTNDNYESLDDTKYERIFDFSAASKTGGQSGIKTSKPSRQHWKAGTGYSHSGAADWNYDEYVQLQKEKDMEIQSIFQKIIDDMLATSPGNMQQLYKVMESSYLIPFVKSYLQGTTILEINKHKNLYQLIFTFLQNIATEDSIYLFDDSRGKTNLYGLLEELNKEATQITKITTASDNGFIENDESDLDLNVIAMISVIFEMVTPCFTDYMEIKLLKETESTNSEQTIECSDDDKVNKEHKLYEETMVNYRFDMAKFVDKGFTYKPEALTNKAALRRLASEYGSLSKNLPVFFGSSIFVCVDETNTRCMRTLITGPEGTPYDNGIFIFDVYIGDEYPKGPPKMKLVNHGKIRFNPNLYNCGKVCLSLLGTWKGGHKGEDWNNDSTLQQLFISAQAQILIDQPLYNEPGHESSQNSTSGQKSSKTYNNYVRYYTMCHAMHDLIKYVDKYPEFKEVMIKHFSLKKDYILKTCKTWVDESFETSSSVQHNGKLNQQMYQEKYDEIEKLLNDL